MSEDTYDSQPLVTEWEQAFHSPIPPYDMPPDDEDPEELEPASDDEHPF